MSRYRPMTPWERAKLAVSIVLLLIATASCAWFPIQYWSAARACEDAGGQIAGSAGYRPLCVRDGLVIVP